MTKKQMIACILFALSYFFVRQVVDAQVNGNRDTPTYELGKYVEDINGDGEKDFIKVYGDKSNPSALLNTKIYMIWTDGKTKKAYNAEIKGAQGLPPNLNFGDVNGDKVNEVLFEVPIGDEVGASNYYLYSFKDDKATMLMDSKQLRSQLTITAFLQDEFVMRVSVAKLDLRIPVSIYGFKNEYIKEGFYSKDGKLLKKDSYKSDLILRMILRDVDNDGIAELISLQEISGFSEDLELARFNVVSKLDGQILVEHEIYCENKIYQK